ncbi:MAG: DUF4386 domain-containing protein [Marinibacterium sp.]|nr:DUF4386 domain-containing protein [Marinibacterium sp.]
MTLSSHPPATPGTAQVRLAGLYYLVIILMGVGGAVILREPVLSSDAPDAIVAGTAALRLSLLSDAVMVLADVALALAFFDLLRGRGEQLARAAMVFRLMQAATIAASLIFLAAAPNLAGAGQAELARQFLTLHATGYDIGLLFFGVNTLLMTVLLRRGGAVPGVLVWGLAASGMVYLTGSVLRMVAPDLQSLFAPAYGVPLLAETGLCLWLLIRARV